MRWWTYAILVVALVCGSIVKADPPRAHGETTLCAERGATHSTARKRGGTQQVARRLAGSLWFALPAPIEVPRPPRMWIDARVAITTDRTGAPIVATSARAPPA